MKRLRPAPRPGRLPAPAPPVNPPIDCLRCGVCCFSRLETFVRVEGGDWARLGDAAGRVAHFIGHRAYMKMSEGHCAALEIRQLAEGGRQYFCTVYADRPQICRDLARGSPQCQGERAAKAGRVAGLMKAVIASPAEPGGLSAEALAKEDGDLALRLCSGP